MKALLIDDDHELASLLREYFSEHGVTLLHADTGPRGLLLLDREPPDVVLLDVMLPGIDGFEVCRQVRATRDVPILMLTARGDDADRIVGLELGADDYVPKPFNPRELLARMRAVLRRARPAAGASAGPRGAVPDDRIVVGTLVVDVGAHRVTLDAREIALTAFELRVLVALARRAGDTVTREQLAQAVLGDQARGYDPSVDRSLDVHVSHLRQKLGDARWIRTVRGIGYVLVRGVAP